MQNFWFDVIERNSAVNKLGVQVKRNCIIGFAGRSIEKTMEHIHELEAIGVPAPKSIPMVYTNPTCMLTQDEEIEIIGKESSGEVEFIILKHQGQVFVGIGSDHTDRGMESYSVVKSKSVCQKPVGKKLWKYEDIRDHWDELEMKSWQTSEDCEVEVEYQSGHASAILPLEKLVAAAEEEYLEVEDCIIFSGTVPLLNGMVYGKKFRAEILDNKLGRKLELEYSIKNLPID